MNTKVDLYLIDGCGRCPLGGTPNCKVNNWPKELRLLREIILDCGLTEELKWGVPCYTFQQSNILILAAFKAYCSVSFFKGALLQDNEKILSKPGENTQTARLIKFTNTQQILELQPTIKAYIYEAIEVEKAGVKVNLNKSSELQFPVEFQNKLTELPALKIAFEQLTPGRQRAYNIYISAAKQAKTRTERIEKYIPLIMEGKGLND